MDKINKLQFKIANAILKRKLKKHHRKLAAINLDEAKSIAIIAEINLPEERKEIADFIKPYLKDGVKCNVFAYVSRPTDSISFISDTIYTFIRKEDFNIFLQPKNSEVLNFIKKDWDFVILLSQKPNFLFKWMISQVKKAFVTGPSSEFENFLDFIVKGENLSIKDILKEINLYFGEMKIIKN